MCRMCRLGRIHICPIRSTSRNERPCTKRRFPDYITGIYMHPRSTHHTATLHSSQPGHLFAVVLLRCGDKLSLRRDWRAYAHYSGCQSFTKGLLLIDKSGGSMRQMLEITSQDCKWKAKRKRRVDSGAPGTQ